jgi:hypothetical protein
LRVRQTAVMGISYMLRGDTRQECQQALDELCRAVGAVPTILPTDRHGSGWLARAVVTPKAPAVDEGPVER